MKTTLYLATAGGLMVVSGSHQDWRGSICLPERPVQCVAVDSERNDRAFCGTFGDGLFLTSDAGRTWQPQASLHEPNVMALATAPGGILYAGIEMSALYRSVDTGATWQPLHTLSTLPSATTWSFPPRPETHHVQAILPDLANPNRLQVAIEAGALVYTDDTGATWCDRVPGSPNDTHSLAVHPDAPARLHSAAGDGYFESTTSGDTWQRISDGLQHPYCWDIAVSAANPSTLILSAAASAYGAHYEASANSVLYRRTAGGAWQPLVHGLPHAKGSRIAVLSASRLEPGTFYCSIEGRIFRSTDDGLEWQELKVYWDRDASPENAIDMAIAEGE